MEDLHNAISATLNKLIEEYPEKAEEIDFERIIAEVTPEAVRLIKDTITKSAKKMLEDRRTRDQGFERRNIKRWSKAFDLLETHIAICTESGEEFNSSYRSEAVGKNDLVFDVAVRLHARSCHIAEEILCLLKAGFADAAHARWRALHEVNVTAQFIAKHGQDCAKRFYLHEVVDSYDAMIEHKKYEDRLQEKATSQDEIDSCKVEYDELIKLYGHKFGDHYGWASNIFTNHKRTSFTAIEKNVGLDHMRPYYKWASLNIHSGSKGMRSRLGLSEAKEDGLLVGRSNSGMTDPAHATAISLTQITCTLLMLKPKLDHVFIMRIIHDFQEEIGDAFLETMRNTS